MSGYSTRVTGAGATTLGGMQLLEEGSATPGTVEVGPCRREEVSAHCQMKFESRCISILALWEPSNSVWWSP